MKDADVKARLLWVPLEYEDLTSEDILYTKVRDSDADMTVPIAPTYNSTGVYIPLDFDFTERKYTYHYFTTRDIITNIGGLNVFIVKLLGIVAPFFVMYFLYCLGKLLQEKNLAAYRKERKAFLGNTK